MKASIGFCPQRADLILLTDEVRGRAGFLRPQVEANVVRRLIFITLEERFQNLSHKSPPRTFFKQKNMRRSCFSATAIFGKQGFATVFS